MASSCGPFHEEALRRQRVIDKKRAAMRRMALLQEEEERMAEEKARLDAEAKQKRHDDKMRELQEHLNAVKGSGRSSKKKKGIPEDVMKTIKAKGKILRDSNLVIGHPNAIWEAK